MLTIIVPNYYNYDDLNNIILEFIKVKNEYVHMVIVDAGDKLSSKSKIHIHNANNIDVYFGLSSGVYEAFNYGISKLKTKYYMILGVDDIFSFNKLNLITNTLKDVNYDLLFLGVQKSGIKLNRLHVDSILLGPQGVFPSHTGGIIINKDLHKNYGLYSREYKVLADCYFICQCLLEDKIKFGILDDIFCLVGDEGFSKKKELLSEYEAMKIRIKFGQTFLKSYYFFLMRSLKRVIKKILYLMKLR